MVHSKAACCKEANEHADAHTHITSSTLHARVCVQLARKRYTSVSQYEVHTAAVTIQDPISVMVCVYLLCVHVLCE